MTAPFPPLSLVRAGDRVVPVDLVVPDDPGGLVALVAGAGGGRTDPRARWVAAALARSGFATLLAELAEPGGPADAADAADRLAAALAWAATRRHARDLPVGIVGIGAGAAIARIAAARTRARAVTEVPPPGGAPLDPVALDEATAGLVRWARRALRGEDAAGVDRTGWLWLGGRTEAP